MLICSQDRPCKHKAGQKGLSAGKRRFALPCFEQNLYFVQKLMSPEILLSTGFYWYLT